MTEKRGKANDGGEVFDPAPSILAHFFWRFHHAF